MTMTFLFPFAVLVGLHHVTMLALFLIATLSRHYHVMQGEGRSLLELPTNAPARPPSYTCRLGYVGGNSFERFFSCILVVVGSRSRRCVLERRRVLERRPPRGAFYSRPSSPAIGEDPSCLCEERLGSQPPKGRTELV